MLAITKLLPIVAVAVFTFTNNAQAQNAPVQIGGPNGIVMGGGMGFKMGGRNGVHFGGGQGTKFGPPEFGMHFGNGQGARFGGHNMGMQFGGGEGARFGSREFGMQFGNGEGARFGSKETPLMKFGGNGTFKAAIQQRRARQAAVTPPVLSGPNDQTKSIFQPREVPSTIERAPAIPAVNNLQTPTPAKNSSIRLDGDN